MGRLAIAWMLVFAASSPAGDRPLWTTGKITGSPEPPPPYAAPRAFAGAKFVRPLLWTPVPNSTAIVVGEQNGKLFQIDTAQPAAEPLLLVDLKARWTELVPNPAAKEFEFVYGVAFDPGFATNRYVYISYTMRGIKGEKTGPFDPEKNFATGTRVSRFVWQAGETPTIDLKTETVIIVWPQGGHNGADLHFGNDGYLYISTGDAADPNPPDPWKTGTDCTDLLGSILRIDVSKSDGDKNYAIPADNPFLKATQHGKPVRPEIWSYGYRNPWRMSFDRPTGDLWIGDVGWEQWEMVHRATKGSNHGWSVVEGRQPMNATHDLGPTAAITPPVVELDHTQAASVTGGYVYRGTKFPELVGKYIFGDYMTKRIWAATIKDGQCESLVDLVEPTIRIVTFGLDAKGEIYLVDYDSGLIHTLERNATPAYDPKVFPTTLSQTGLFANAAKNELAAGVNRFEIIAPAWHDGATGDRFFAVPGDGKIIDYDGRKQLGGNIEWLPFTYHFPKDSILGKTLSIRTTAGVKRIETQLLHYDGRYWQAYTYRWRDDESDGDLVAADGGERDLTLPDERMAAGTRHLTWSFNSRAQCLTCHTPWAEVGLAFTPLQLNRPGPDGKNQLVSLCESGLLERRKTDDKPNKPHTATSVRSLETLVDPHDRERTLNDRARSYLHVNCSHCHRNGGGGSVAFELTLGGDIKKNVWDCPPTRGDFGIAQAKVIAPGVPTSSTLLYRMAKFGRDRMPHIGAELPDPNGLALISEWIASKKPDGATVAKPRDGTTESAILAAVMAAQVNSIEPLARRQMAELPPGPQRDLFEGYLPQSGDRKLGANPRPRAILSLTGDADRGQAIFADANRQCAKCHRVDGVGIAVGPDLSKIGKERNREQLLESLLEPSRKVDAKYQAYTVTLVDGRQVVGVLTKNDAAGVTLRDALGKDLAIARADIDAMKSSPTSLMTAGLLADLTPQQAADLLAYLEARKSP
jgi:putative heme-binding domain-containing protein